MYTSALTDFYVRTPQGLRSNLDELKALRELKELKELKEQLGMTALYT